MVVGAFDDVDPWKSTHGSVRSTVCPALTTSALDVTV